MYRRYWRFGFPAYVPVLHSVLPWLVSNGSIESIFNQLADAEEWNGTC
jgi:hypothetical protein